MSLSIKKRMNYLIDGEALCKDSKFVNSSSDSAIDTTNDLNKELADFLDNAFATTPSSFYHRVDNQRHSATSTFPSQTNTRICIYYCSMRTVTDNDDKQNLAYPLPTPDVSSLE